MIPAGPGEVGCPRCGGAVYEAEKVVAGENVWFHKARNKSTFVSDMNSNILVSLGLLQLPGLQHQAGQRPRGHWDQRGRLLWILLQVSD